MIDYSKFQSSLKHLELQYENHLTIDQSFSDLIKEGIQESVIQRFKICYDCMWKVLKRYLIEELGLPEVPNSPKPIFKISNENQMFSSDISQWLSYADARIGISHDYSGEKAQAAINLMADFIDDAVGLYQTMSGKSWE